MLYPFSAIDLTRQLVKMSANPNTGATEAWFTDLMIKGFSLIGLLSVSFETDAPSNYRKLWFDAGQPPTGVRGVLKVYDPDLEAWVPLTPQNYHLYETRLTRAAFWYTSELAAGTYRPPADEAQVGDYWEHDTGGDNELSILRQTAPGQYQWVDITGGELDQAYVIDGNNHEQTVAATVWTITHDLGYRPVVQTWDASGAELDGTVAHISANQLTITFATAQTGIARLA